MLLRKQKLHVPKILVPIMNQHLAYHLLTWQMQALLALKVNCRDCMLFYENSFIISFDFNSFDASSISLCESIDRQKEFSYLTAFNFLSFAIIGKAVSSILPFSGK